MASLLLYTVKKNCIFPCNRLDTGTVPYCILNDFTMFSFAVSLNLSIVQYSEMSPLRFGSWLCSRLQVNIPNILGPIEGAKPSPYEVLLKQVLG
jgi:hypothetical protein